MLPSSSRTSYCWGMPGYAAWEDTVAQQEGSRLDIAKAGTNLHKLPVHSECPMVHHAPDE
eukprot:6218338-Pyramimonas_sp.AAC.1